MSVSNEKISEIKNSFSNKKIISLISAIFIASLLMRLYYYDSSIPITNDSLNYFFYAMDIKITGHIPENYSLGNNGWPLFLSLFFSTFQFDNAQNYMQLQQIITILISSLTIIPVYLLCKRFFNPIYSLMGAAIIGFEPHLIQNSILGITDSLYIFLVASSFWLFLDSRQKIVYCSFGLVAIATIVRSEGVFLFFTISLMYFIINRKNRQELVRYVFPLAIFILILTPMIFYQTSIFGDDRMFARTAIGIEHLKADCSICGPDNISGIPFILQGIENFPKYLGWSMIPILIFFVPIGIILVLKDLNAKTGILISSLVVMSLPAFYAYAVPLQDLRYLFFLYPIFCVVSLFTIRKLLDAIPQRKNLIILLILIGVIVLSIFYLNEKIDNIHQNESIEIAKILSHSKKTINDYSPESTFLEISDIAFSMTDFRLYFFNERAAGESIRNSIEHNVIIKKINGFNSINELIDLSKNTGITHLVVDLQENRNESLIEIYNNEEQFPFLKKIFDSNDYGFDYKMKVFEINYERFNEIKQ